MNFSAKRAIIEDGGAHVYLVLKT